MHLWLGSGEIESLEVEQFGAYWRRLRRRLAAVMADPVADGIRPEKCSYCEFCEYSQQCQDAWRAADSLEYVAGIRKKEKDAFEEADIATVVELAEADRPTPLVSPARQDRLRRQAELQVVSRTRPDDPPAFRSVPAWRGSGLGTRLRQSPRTGPWRRLLRPRGPSLLDAELGPLLPVRSLVPGGWGMDLRGPMGPRPRRTG